MSDPISAILKAERKRRHMTLTQTGEACGTSLQQIHAWEAGYVVPRLDNVRKWAAVFGFDVVLAARAGGGE
jgi:transcriptional regulator with XRE-family HTH domain